MSRTLLTQPNDLAIYTIGHSKHEWNNFLGLLRSCGITLVADVRSRPYSRWSPQFNYQSLVRALGEAGLGYRFMGEALGGRPSDPVLYDPGQARPNYQRMAQSPAYQSGIDRLLALARTERIALICAEGDHRRCHRHWLIAQTLLARGTRVLHIEPDGSLVPGGLEPQQTELFDRGDLA